MYYNVRRAKYVRDYIIHFTFADGSEREIDFGPHLWGEVFEPLKNKEYFRNFRVRFGTITWPNGADIAPETLHDDVWPEHEEAESRSAAG